MTTEQHQSQDQELAALRAENARLREALERIGRARPDRDSFGAEVDLDYYIRIRNSARAALAAQGAR